MNSATESVQHSSGSKPGEPGWIPRHTPGISVIEIIQGRTSIGHRLDVSFIARVMLRLVKTDEDIEQILNKAGFTKPRGDWLITEYLITGIHYLDKVYRLKILEHEIEEYCKRIGEDKMYDILHDDTYGNDIFGGAYGGL